MKLSNEVKFGIISVFLIAVIIIGVENVIWLPEGLAEDLQRDEIEMHYGTDGNVDLFMDFIAPDKCLLLSVPDDNPSKYG